MRDVPGNPCTNRIALGGVVASAPAALSAPAPLSLPFAFFATWLCFSRAWDSALRFCRTAGSRAAGSNVPSALAVASDVARAYETRIGLS